MFNSNNYMPEKACLIYLATNSSAFGGTLISHRQVLVAASCIPNRQMLPQITATVRRESGCPYPTSYNINDMVECPDIDANIAILIVSSSK